MSKFNGQRFRIMESFALHLFDQLDEDGERRHSELKDQNYLIKDDRQGQIINDWNVSGFLILHQNPIPAGSFERKNSV